MTASRTRKKLKTPEDALPLRLLNRPLESLAFLLPLILFYEIGCFVAQYVAPDGGDPERVVAFHLLQVFFRLFGPTGVWMPGLAVIIILLCTHAASHQPWTVRSRVVGMMYLESALLAAPLLAFNYVLRASPLATPQSGHLLTDVVLGVGAGVYEELVFRLILISFFVMIGKDLLRLPGSITVAAAIVLSALTFAAHHHPPWGGEPFTTEKFVFRTLAGGYLGVLFVVRGYGPAVGTHAAYNVLITLL